MNHGRLGGIRQTPGYLQTQPCHLPEETGVQLLYAASYVNEVHIVPSRAIYIIISESNCLAHRDRMFLNIRIMKKIVARTFRSCS